MEKSEYILQYVKKDRCVLRRIGYASFDQSCQIARDIAKMNDCKSNILIFEETIRVGEFNNVGEIFKQ